MDGFIASFSVSDGRPLRRVRMGYPVIGLCAMSSGFLAVGTRHGLLRVGPDWCIQDSYQAGLRQLCRLNEDKLLIARDDGTLELLAYDPIREKNV
jgi:hypothetical protein